MSVPFVTTAVNRLNWSPIAVTLVQPIVVYVWWRESLVFGLGDGKLGLLCAKNYAPRSRLNRISDLQRAEIRGECLLPTEAV